MGLKRMTQGVLLLLMLLTPLVGMASDGDRALPAYRAEYKTKVGGLGVTLTRTLTEHQGQYQLTQSGKKGFLIKLSEDTDFTVQDGQVVGDHFVYQLSGVANRRREVIFDKPAGVIRSLRKEKWTEHPWTDDALDRLSLQEQFRLILLNSSSPPNLVALSVVDGDRIKPKQFELLETVVIDTAVGPLNTLHYRERREDPEKRRSDTWLAVDHTFLMVRTEHVEDGSTTVIELLSGSVEDQPITGPALAP
jgi:hypothetical protein